MEKHPSYGKLQVYRVQGDPGKLYGSHLDHQNSYIEMRLTHGGIERDHYTDRYYAYGPSLFELRLSAAQFTELLTTLNLGTGIPCTITRSNGEDVQQLPDSEDSDVTESANISRNFSAMVTEKAQTLRENEKRLNAILEKKGALTKKDRKEISSLYKGVLQHFEGNASFALTCFKEATEKVVVESKANVDAFVTGALSRIGLNSIREKFVSDAVSNSLSLAEGPADDNVIEVLPPKK